MNIFESDFTSTGTVSLDFSEPLFPLDHFLKGNKTIDDLNQNLEFFIKITYNCQMDHDEAEVDGYKLVDIPVLKSYKLDSFSDMHIDFSLEFTKPLHVSSQP